MGWLSRLLGTSPEAKYEKCIRRGHAAVERRRYAEALAAYDQALAIDTGKANLWRWKVATLMQMERRDEALACCDAGLRVHPRESELWGWRGQILALLARPEDAAASFDCALEIAPRDVLLHTAKAFHLLYRMHLDNEVIASADQGLAVDPNHCELLEYKAEALMNTDREEEALECLDRLLVQPGLDPLKKLHALRTKADALRALGRNEEAAQCEKKAKDMSGNLR